MFLAAAPYFQKRFAASEWIQVHFLSAIMLVFTVTNLGSMWILTRLQANASYPKRIIAALFVNIVAFSLLALSTVAFRQVGAGGYFVFTLATVFAASLATGLCQNGVFAYVSGFGRPEYTQAIMTGQAVAGVLPCIARRFSTLRDGSLRSIGLTCYVEIVSVLSIPPSSKPDAPSPGDGESTKSAFTYFLASTTVSAMTLAAFLYLLARRNESRTVKRSVTDIRDMSQSKRTSVSMWALFIKLRWLALAVSTCFAVTMVFPVFTKVRLPSTYILSPSSFHVVRIVTLTSSRPSSASVH